MYLHIFGRSISNEQFRLFSEHLHSRQLAGNNNASKLRL